MTVNSIAKKARPNTAASKKSRSVKGLSLVAKFKDGHVIIESRLGDSSPRVLKRSSLVGKFPEVKHFSAPRAALKIDADTRKQMLALMKLS